MSNEFEVLHPPELEKPIDDTNLEIKKLQATKRNSMKSVLWKLSKYMELSNKKQKNLKDVIKSMQKTIE